MVPKPASVAGPPLLAARVPTPLRPSKPRAPPSARAKAKAAALLGGGSIVLEGGSAPDFVAAAPPASSPPLAVPAAACAPPPRPVLPRGIVRQESYVSVFPSAAPTPAEARALNDAFALYEHGSVDSMERRGAAPRDIVGALMHKARDELRHTEDELMQQANERKHAEVCEYLRALASTSVYPALEAAHAEEARARRAEAARVRAVSKAAAALYAPSQDAGISTAAAADSSPLALALLDNSPAAAAETAPPTLQLFLPYGEAHNHKAFVLWSDARAAATKPTTFGLVARDCEACDRMRKSLRDFEDVVELRECARAPSRTSTRREASSDPAEPPAHHEVRFVMGRTLPGEGGPPPLMRLGVDARGEWVLKPSQARACFQQPRRRRALAHQALAVRLYTQPSPLPLPPAELLAAAAAPKRKRNGMLLAPPDDEVAMDRRRDAQAPAAPDTMLLYWVVGSGKTEGALRLYAAAPRTRRPLLVIACPNTMIAAWMEAVTRGPHAPPDSVTDVHVVGHTELEALLAKGPQARDGTPLALEGATVILDEAHAYRNLTKPGRYVLSGIAMADRRFLLTGTPIQNDGDEVHGLRALLGLDAPATAGLDGEGRALPPSRRPSPAALADEIRGAWPRLAVLHVDPSADPVTAHRYPAVRPAVTEVAMSWMDTLHYVMGEAKVVTLGDVTICSSKSNSYRVHTRLACNTARKFDAVVANALRIAEGGIADTFPHPLPPDAPPPRVRQFVHSRFIERGIDEIEARLAAAWVTASDGKEATRRRLFLRRITGQTPTEKRAMYIADYNAGAVDVLLISACGAEGVNLMATTAIHLVEPADNLSTEAQTRGRATRFDSHAQPGSKRAVASLVAEAVSVPQIDSPPHAHAAAPPQTHSSSAKKQKREHPSVAGPPAPATKIRAPSAPKGAAPAGHMSASPQEERAAPPAPPAAHSGATSAAPVRRAVLPMLKRASASATASATASAPAPAPATPKPQALEGKTAATARGGKAATATKAAASANAPPTPDLLIKPASTATSLRAILQAKLAARGL